MSVSTIQPAVGFQANVRPRLHDHVVSERRGHALANEPLALPPPSWLLGPAIPTKAFSAEFKAVLESVVNHDDGGRDHENDELAPGSDRADEPEA